jgi:hypothetical protein
MFRHVVLFRWNADAAEVDKDAVARGLAELPDQIGSLRAYRFGPDAHIDGGAWDFAVVADFDDQAGYLRYRDHPAHRQLVADVIAPVVSERAAVQYQFEA